MINKFRLQHVPFILSHLIISVTYNMFPNSRHKLSKNYGLKVFRLVFYIMQGIAVSTEFLMQNIHEYFADNLLDMISLTADSDQFKTTMTYEQRIEKQLKEVDAVSESISNFYQNNK